MINVKQIGKPKSGGGSVTTNVQIGGSGGYEQLYQSLAGKVDTEFFKRLFGAIGADGAEMEVNDADTEVASLRVKTGVWTNEFVSALGLGDGSGGGSGGGVDILLSWDEYSDDKSGWALSAKLGKELLDMIGGDGPGDGFVSPTRKIIAGAGLTGGGTLADDVTLALAAVGTPGTYTKVTVDAYGRVTGHGELSPSDITGLTDEIIRLIGKEISGLFAEEMQKWFVRDTTSKGLRPADYGGEPYGLYSRSYVSAYGVSDGQGGQGGGTDVLLDWGDYSAETSSWALGAKLGYGLYQDMDRLANSCILSVRMTGSGCAVTNVAKNGTELVATRGDVPWTGVTGKPDLVYYDPDTNPEGLMIEPAEARVDFTMLTGAGNMFDTVQLPAATQSLAGAMSAADKKELDLLATLFERVTLADGSYAIRANYGLYSVGFVSALGVSDGGGAGGGTDILQSWDEYSAETSAWALGAKLGYELYQSVNSLMRGSALTVSVTGSGGVVTDVTKNGTALVVTKGGVSWSQVTGKPSTFTPSAHTHPLAQVSDLHADWDALLKAAPSAYVTRWPSWAEVTGKPSTFTPSAHTHTWAQVTDKPLGLVYYDFDTNPEGIEFAASASNVEVTMKTGTGGDFDAVQFPMATQSLAGAMSAADKREIDRLAALDLVYYDRDTNPEGLEIERGSSYINVTMKTGSGGDFDTVQFPMVTQSLAGAMSAADKKELDLLATLFERVTLADGSYAIRANYGLYSVGFVSALGVSDGGGAGGGTDILQSWDEYSAETSAWALGAKLGYELYQSVNSLMRGSALTVSVTGSGGVVTDVTKNGTALVVTKGGVSWSQVTGKPTSFTPSAHTHTWAQVTDKPPGLVYYDMDTNPNGIEFTASASNVEVTMKTGTGGDFDTLQFPMATQSLAGAMSAADKKKLDSALTSVSWSQVTGKPSTFTPSSHTHTWAQVTGKPSGLVYYDMDTNPEGIEFTA